MSFSEQWKPVIGYEGHYEVSSFGRVKSLPRRVISGKSWRDTIAIILVPWVSKSGYLQHSVWSNGRSHSRFVHRLVLEAFIGFRPDDMQCRHLDGNRTNNYLENLRWGTSQENSDDCRKHKMTLCGEKNRSSKLKDDEVRCIKMRLKCGESQHSIACDFPVGRSTIQKIKSGEAWSHVSI